MVKGIMMEKLKLELESLRDKESALKKVLDKSFSNKEEFYDFVEKNKELIKELKNIRKAIKDIEWQLMNDQEKTNHLEYLKRLKNKFKDDK